ncbi:flagellar motor protein MotD [Aquitalea sp. S1-19]|nr:flagellar motor protein MotD [Aquitalea sp. S1-19]
MRHRRRRQEEEHENHERWLVSYADFITLLFAFFVVMYAISQVNESKYRVLSSSLGDAFGSKITGTPTPSGSANTMVEVPNSKPVARAIKSEQRLLAQQKMQQLSNALSKIVQPLLKNGQVRLYQSEEGIHIDIKDTALFAVAQATPSPESQRMLAGIAGVLRSQSNPVRVEGFTDDVPIRNAFYPSNWELSAARAGSVVRLFQENGIAADRLVAVGRAENRPVTSNASAEGRAKNRRVAITVLADHNAGFDITPAANQAAEASAPAIQNKPAQTSM